MSITFTPLVGDDRQKLLEVLRVAAQDGSAILMDRRDTSFLGTADAVTDTEVITAIRSVPTHCIHSAECQLALTLLRGSPEYTADARQGAPVGNSVVGSLLSLPPHSIPRKYAEHAVQEALAILDAVATAAPIESAQGTYTLPRSGQAPLRFQGDLLAASNGQWQSGRDWTRWHELAVYRTARGQYVVQIGYRTRYQGELDHDTAVVVDSAAEVCQALTNYNPAGVIRGYPPGQAYEERQSKLLADVRARYDAQVSEICSAAPEFAEEV